MDHPSLNDQVLLRDSAEREYQSRVEDIGDGLLVVARPRNLPADESFGAGTAISVVWADTAGDVTALPTQILSAYDDGTLPVWSLVVTGPAVQGQRRRYPRALADGEVVIRSAADETAATVTGDLIDFSEAAVHCVVEVGAADQFVIDRAGVIAEFHLDSADFAIPGHVELLRATKQPTEFEELVVIFDQPVADVDALREQVSAREILAEGDD